jgi:COP9 signalosome complex subunit 1
MEEIYNAKDQSSKITSVLDLEKYLQNYSGHTRFIRLLHWFHSPNLKSEAYDLLIVELLKSSNTNLFRKLVEEKEISENNNLFDEWFTSTERNLTSSLSVLENELLTAKSTTVKESIRLAYCELGNLYCKWGKFDEAFKSFLRSRDYCSVPKHHSDVAYQLILLSFDMKQFYNANNFVNKVLDVSTDLNMLHKAKIIQGLLLILNENQFHQAVSKFLEIGVELPNEEISAFMSIYDLGFYVFVLGLATMNYQELKNKLVNNKLFMNYYFSSFSPTGNTAAAASNAASGLLSPVKGGSSTAAPEMVSPSKAQQNVNIYNPYAFLKFKQLLNDLMNNNFISIFEQLPTIYQLLSVDIYLSKYANVIMKSIIERLLLQYITPYQILSLDQILSTFPSIQDANNLKSILIYLISKNKLNYKINLINNILLKNEKDYEKDMYSSLSTLIEKNAYNLKRGLLRNSLIKNHFVLDVDQGENSGANSFGGRMKKMSDLHEHMRGRRGGGSGKGSKQQRNQQQQQQMHQMMGGASSAIPTMNEEDLSDHEDMDEEVMMAHHYQGGGNNNNSNNNNNNNNNNMGDGYYSPEDDL